MISFLNSEDLISKNWEILLYLTLKPESTHELVIALLLSIVVIAVTLAKTHSLGGTGSGSIMLSLFVTIFSIFGLMQTAILTELLLFPLMDKVFQPFAYFSSIIVGFFLLIVPFTRTCFRAEYFSSIGAWTVSLILGGMVIYGVDNYFVDKEENAPTPQSVQKYTQELSEKIKNKGAEALGKNKNQPASENKPEPAPTTE
jgi:hypothetical protein